MNRALVMAAAAVIFVSTSASAFAQTTMSTTADPKTVSTTAATPASISTDAGSDCPFGTAPSIDNCGFFAVDAVKAIGDTASAKVREIKDQVRAKTALDPDDLRQAHLDTEQQLLEFQATYKAWLASAKDQVRGAVLADVKKANTAATTAVNNLRTEAYKVVKIN